MGQGFFRDNMRQHKAIGIGSILIPSTQRMTLQSRKTMFPCLVKACQKMFYSITFEGWIQDYY